MRQVVRERDYLRNAEIEQPHLIPRIDLDVGRLNISVHNCPLSSVDLRDEGMQPPELAQYFARVADSAGRVEPLLRLYDFGDVPAFHILHGYEEATALFAEIVDFEDAWIHLAQLLLDQHATAFGGERELR